MKRTNESKVLIPVIALLISAVVVLLERYGVTYKYTDQKQVVKSEEKTDAVETDTTCLILKTDDDTSPEYADMMAFVLDDMKIGYDIRQADDSFSCDTLDDYDTVVITFSNWERFGNKIVDIMKWVENGGSMMTTTAPEINSIFKAVSSKLGIVSMGDEYPKVYGFKLTNNVMLGASDDTVFKYALTEDDVLQTSIEVELNDKCNVWMKSDDGRVPLIWTKDIGAGRVGIINESILSKYQRAFLCMTYTLLHDVDIYPVINGSAFYLDDFPSPVPDGNSKYIERDYGVDIGTFYSSIWWPTVLGWESEYGIRHTGMIIEQYSEETEAPFEGNSQVSQFETFGNMLLNNNGELGFHGYNHMPLCIMDIDEDKKYGDYKLWKSKEDAEASIEELTGFCKNLFPDNEFTVYVPPSNILSETGREALLSANPDIKTISSTYLVDAGNKEYVQEFCVEDDGIVSAPRITSGCEIDNYQMISALAELNYHYVQSHFMHPDDVLDEDRGAADGWEKMSSEFEKYLDWVHEAAPDIRNLTGSEMGRAVEVFDSLSVKREYKDNELDVELGGFEDQAQLMLRINKGSITGASGCEYEKLGGNLYLIKAASSKIRIYLGE